VRETEHDFDKRKDGCATSVLKMDTELCSVSEAKGSISTAFIPSTASYTRHFRHGLQQAFKDQHRSA
jgi:hypothetical protein